METIQTLIQERDYLNSIEITEDCVKAVFNVYDFKIFKTTEEFNEWLTKMDK